MSFKGLRNVVLLDLSAYFCLFFTKFVLLFYKISKKNHLLQGSHSMSEEKRSFFGYRSTEGLFLVFNLVLFDSWIAT